MAAEIRRAYDDSGDAWGSGPARVYRALAEPVLVRAGDVTGKAALDVGTGSGVLADELVRRGAWVLGLDASLGMLRRDAHQRPPAVVADVRALPLRPRAVDLVTATFVLNHLEDPVPAVRELVRVLRPGGRVLATTFEGDAPHPAKAVVDDVASAFGYVAPDWYLAVKQQVMPVLSTPEAFSAAGRAGGLHGIRVERVAVRVDLSPSELAAWRFGMAHLAPFVGRLGERERIAMLAVAEEALAEACAPVELAVLLLEASVAET